MALLIVVTFMISLVSAGFGSTFLEKKNGKLIFEVEPGIVRDYFIYPQNLGNETQYLKIVLSDPNDTVQNRLKDVYEIMPNTQSDEFPIKLEIKVSDRTLPGTSFPLSYEVFTTDKKPDNGMVSFSPVGFGKSFYVEVKKLESDKPFPWIWIIIPVAIAIIVFIYFLVRKIKKKE